MFAVTFYYILFLKTNFPLFVCVINIFPVEEGDKQIKSSSIIKSEEHNKKANEDETVDETVDEGLFSIHLFIFLVFFFYLFILLIAE